MTGTKVIGTPWTASGTGAAINGVMHAKTSSGHEYEYEVILARTMTPFFHARTLKERKDVALLIAAAPELFEALTKFVEQWNACGPNSDFGRYFSSVRTAAVAALAKATGEKA